MRLLALALLPFAVVLAMCLWLLNAARPLMAYVVGHGSASDTTQALTQPELQDLARCLAAQDGEPAHPISNLWALDGYLTATVIGPAPMSPCQWLVPLLGRRLSRGERLQDALHLIFDMRNSNRTQAREMMADRISADRLTREEVNMTWEQIIESRKARGLSGDDIYRSILNSSQKTRASVNKQYGLE